MKKLFLIVTLLMFSCSVSELDNFETEIIIHNDLEYNVVDVVFIDTENNTFTSLGRDIIHFKIESDPYWIERTSFGIYSNSSFSFVTKRLAESSRGYVSFTILSNYLVKTNEIISYKIDSNITYNTGLIELSVKGNNISIK